MNLEEIFAQKRTENGDIAFDTTGSKLLDILFMSEYYQKYIKETPIIGTSRKERLFSMFMRDPRNGLGRRDLGRWLMYQSGVAYEFIAKAGRFDDLIAIYAMNKDTRILDYLKEEILKGNELAKKWMPRYSSKNLMLAREIAKYWGMNKQQYGKFVKCNTTENKLSRKTTDDIKFESVPSLAMIKYFKRFATGEDTKERFAQYQEDVKSGKKELHVATTTVYDIYKNKDKIDPDLFFDKLEKISGSWIPVVDSSGSMQDMNDSYGKAMAIGHYLAKCSSYAPNKVVSFSSKPQLLTLGERPNARINAWWATNIGQGQYDNAKSQYEKEIASMYTGDCSNTDFGAVMKLLQGLDKDNAPEWIVVLSDMEFDYGSRQSKKETMKLFKEAGFKTKIVWWNFNSRATTTPEMDKDGNVYLSGYNPMLLKFLQAGFDGQKFLDTLLEEYAKTL